MLPSIGFPEMLVIVLLAIIFVGPKDLPKLMRTIGQWMAKFRAMGNEFKSAFDDMGVDDEVAAITVPVKNVEGAVVAAITVYGPTFRLRPFANRQAILENMHKAVEQLQIPA